jgi:hypothetical protein
MSVELSNDTLIRMSRACPQEDAESLLRLLVEQPGRIVDWTACDIAHTAVIQVLLALRPDMVGPPVGGFLRTWINPLLQRQDVAR